MELTKDLIEKIEKTHDSVIRMEMQIGNGKEEGLCADVRNHTKRLRHIELILVLMVGGGSLTGGVIGLVQWLS